MRERASESRWTLWALLDANRHLLTALTMVVVFLVLVGLSQVVAADLRASMDGSDPVEIVVLLAAEATTGAPRPFVLLLAYTLRIVTLAERALPVGPLVEGHRQLRRGEQRRGVRSEATRGT